MSECVCVCRHSLNLAEYGADLHSFAAIIRGARADGRGGDATALRDLATQAAHAVGDVDVETSETQPLATGDRIVIN